MTEYIALIWKEEGTSYGVNFPDFSGFITGGDTLDAAMANAREGLAFHIEGMIENGEAIPTPSTIDQVRGDPHNADAVVALVDVPTAKPKAVRVNITINEDLLRRIDRTAAEVGSTRSGFIAAATIGWIDNLKRRRSGKGFVKRSGKDGKLGKRRSAGVPPKDLTDRR